METKYKTTTKTLSHDEIAEFLKNHNLHKVFSNFEFNNLVRDLHSWTNGEAHKVQEFVSFIA